MCRTCRLFIFRLTAINAIIKIQMISYTFENTILPEFNRKETTRWIKSTAAFYNKKVESISYIFCTDERILEVNQQFLQHDYYTDIITFDYSEHDIISGDLFISLDTVQSNASKFNESFEKELYRVIIHGVLHLCGQNDKTPDEQAEMTKKENLALDNMQIIY